MCSIVYLNSFMVTKMSEGETVLIKNLWTCYSSVGMEEEMIRAIFFDIDGTLVSKKNPRITVELKQVLDTLREKGILLCIATGRHYQEIIDLKINEDYKFDAYITLNGCCCYNDKDMIHKAVISKDDIQSIIKLLKKRDMACTFVEKDILYVNKVNNNVIVAQEAVHTPIPEIRDVNRALEHDIYQIIPYASKKEIQEFLTVTENCVATQWHSMAYDVISKEGGKRIGIEKVLSYYNIKSDETMAFGDGPNDMEMLQFVKVGICMGNGTEEVKKVSNYVTKNIEDNGIIAALQHYQLLK